MEPAREERDDVGAAAAVGIHRAVRAAMEPAREERDDLRPGLLAVPRRVAAMEPAREERDDRRPGPDLPHRRVAAMAPAREERDDLFRPFPGEVFTIPPQWRPLV